MRTLVVFSALLSLCLSAPAYVADDKTPAATYLAGGHPFLHGYAAAPEVVEVKTIETEPIPAPITYSHPAPVAYAQPAPLAYAHPVPAPAPVVEAEPAVVVDAEPAVVVEADPAPLVPAPVAYAHPAPLVHHAYAAPATTHVQTKVGPPQAVPAGPPQRTVHYASVPKVTGYNSVIHKPQVHAPRIGVPTTLIGKVEHQAPEVTVGKYDVNVQRIEPNPVPVKVPVQGAPIYENTVVKHEPVIRTHTAVHHAKVSVPVHTAHAVTTHAVEGGAAYAAPAHAYAAPAHAYAAPAHAYAAPAHAYAAHAGHAYAAPAYGYLGHHSYGYAPYGYGPHHGAYTTVVKEDH